MFLSTEIIESRESSSKDRPTSFDKAIDRPALTKRSTDQLVIEKNESPFFEYDSHRRFRANAIIKNTINKQLNPLAFEELRKKGNGSWGAAAE